MPCGALNCRLLPVQLERFFMDEAEKIMARLLYLYDFKVRLTLDGDDYNCGYADAIGQCILDIGEILGERFGKPYKYKAYSRVMHYDTTENYIKRHPIPEKRP